MKARFLAFIVVLIWCGGPHGMQAADRELRWDALDVDARLDADGVLDVIERHTMVFTGDWNGGERAFNVRPRQRLEFLGVERLDPIAGGVLPLRQAVVPNNVDEFSWSDSRTLRWRSRLPSDPPFANTRLIYVLHYKLSGVLEKKDQQYRIDHDFAFPNRPGSIARFSLGLILDPVWRPLSAVRDRYTAGPLKPGQSFVLTIPLHYSGTGTPIAIDDRRPVEIVGAVIAILGGITFIVIGFLARERSLGRFAPLKTDIDGAWIEKHILANPAEVVGPAWDGRIGTPEVVALISRMTAEGKLESEVEGKYSMLLRLKVDRSTLVGQERALVDGLFFDHSTETSTKAVQQHYKSSGFNPATVITPELQKHVKKVLPPGEIRVRGLVSGALFFVGAALLVGTGYQEPGWWGAVIVATFVIVFLCLLLQIPGLLFKSRIDRPLSAAALLMTPALLLCLGTAAYLWRIPGTGEFELPWTMIGAITAWALCIANTSINSMKSRQGRDAIAFRKSLAAGRNLLSQGTGKVPSCHARRLVSVVACVWAG